MAKQDGLDADVLVEIRPVNTFTITDKPPVRSFFGRAVQQSRIPGQWRPNGATIAEFKFERVFRDGDVLSGRAARFVTTKMIGMPYALNSGSLVMVPQPSCFACAMISRSNGSL